VVYCVVDFSLAIDGVLGAALYWPGEKSREIKRFEQIEERFKQID